jgi:pyruvate dehydrogenase E1 component alpha subunit
VAFVGDSGSNQGTTLESDHLAKVWELPAIFVIEDNGYAESTASPWSVAGSQVACARGFGFDGVEVVGFDFFAVWEAAREAIDKARNGGGQSLLHIELARDYGHFDGDAQTYRAAREVHQLKATRDCLKLFRSRVTAAGLLDAEMLDAIDQACAARIAHCVAEAKAAPYPTADDSLTNVYACN